MTQNEPPNQLEWFIRAHSGVDSGQWGIRSYELQVGPCGHSLFISREAG